MAQWLGWPGRLLDVAIESAVIGGNTLLQGLEWLANINRIRILSYAERKFPECYTQLDGGDKRIMRAFVDPGSISNVVSLLSGSRPSGELDRYRLSPAAVGRWLHDTAGSEATFDNSFVERDAGADTGRERWLFINGIGTSRDLARLNARILRESFKRPFTLIHNPTMGLANDLVESAMQKFTNVNTEPVARAFLEIGHALCEETVEEVVVIAHSQGTIIMGDVLDLLYCSIDRTYFDRTNMTDEDFDAFMARSTGTVKSRELRELQTKLADKGKVVLRKLELYMFANAASRMCYIEPQERYPRIESFANHHDIVTRLGSLARDDFHEEDLIRIDGTLFTLDRYGHLLNAHYLAEFFRGRYSPFLTRAEGLSVGLSVHDPVVGNPCLKHPKHVAGPSDSKLLARYRAAQNPAQKERTGGAVAAA